MLTRERLMHVLNYDPATGAFTWKNPTNNHHKPGDAAGSRSEGYVRIWINRRAYKAHRLAWFYVTGKWPANEIDHINRDGFDNRLDNLREATRSQNMANGVARKNNKSGFKGVHPYRGRWAASICKDRKIIHLGYFPTPEMASAAYERAALELHGSFSRTR